MTIYIDKFTTGLQKDRIGPFINDDAFTVLHNAFIFRNKVKRKRGSTLLGRFRRDITSETFSDTSVAVTWTFSLITQLSLEANSQIVPGTVQITFNGITFTDQGDGTLTNDPDNFGTINYASTSVTLTHNQGAGFATTASLSYYPALPVMGLETLQIKTQVPLLLGLDTVYSYQFNQSTNVFYDTTFYQESGSAFVWSGQDYQQFYSENFQDALFVTNNVPGFHFNDIIAIPDVATMTTFNITITDTTMVVGDKIFFNEISAVTTDLNGITGTITVNVGAGVYTVSVVSAITVTGFISGIVQFLTHSTSGQDGIKYYTGDPTASITRGWVNFSPPLSNLGETGEKPDYLMGAKIVIAFKDRLLFFGVWIGKSNVAPTFFENKLVYSQNGTVFYANIFPAIVSFDKRAWWQNVPAKGGFLDAPVQQEIYTVNSQEDVLLCGFSGSKRKLIFSGDDSFPFYYQGINSELNAQFTYSSINMDSGTIDAGRYAFTFTTQTSCKRIDLQIPDDIFEVSYSNNGQERFTAIKDYPNELIYFTYPLASRKDSRFPNYTLCLNYRESNWATFDENYTHYGSFLRTSNLTWATLPYRTWSEWLKPWNYGDTSQQFPNILGGNQQGFVLIKEIQIKEDHSNYIKSISTNSIISPDHCMNQDDYIQIDNVIGTSSSELNGEIFQVLTVTSADVFTIDYAVTGTYLGAGTFRRIPRPSILTKMFGPFWKDKVKTVCGPSYLFLDNSGGDGQITVNLRTNQSSTIATDSSYQIFSNVINTGPNPDKPGQEDQDQIWHRYGNTVKGDSIQLEITLSDDQMRNSLINEDEIILNSLVIEVAPSSVL